MSLPPPKRDPKSGRWKFRKAVPLDLREQVGKKEVVKWLGADAAKAREANGELHLYWDKRFAMLRTGAGEDTLSPRDAAVLSGEWYRWFTAHREGEDTTSPAGWLHTLDMLEDVRSSVVSRDDESDHTRADEDDFAQPQRAPSAHLLERRVNAFLMDHGQVALFLSEVGQVLSEGELRDFLGAMHGDFYAAHRLLARRAGRDFGKDEHAGKLPVALPKEKSGSNGSKAVTISDLADGYFGERRKLGLSNEAELRWAPLVKKFIAFLEHDRATDVTAQDVLRWRDAMLKEHAPKTVRDSDMAAVKAVFGWGVDNRRLTGNPAKEVRVKVPKKVRTRGPDFTDEEALGLLRAADQYVPGKREFATTTAAKRWVPWLCAFTGSRVAEMTQLRKQDVQRHTVRGEAVYVLNITPEAGSVKTGHYRLVPLHPQLVEKGFLAFVEKAPDGPLFFSAERKGGKRHPSKDIAGKVASWVRGLGVIGEGVDPDHGWRHRFGTVARIVGMDPDIRRALEGRGERSSGEGYGDRLPIEAGKRAIDMLPRYKTAMSATPSTAEG